MTGSGVEINEVKLESKGDSGSQNLLFGAGIGTLFGKCCGSKFQNAKCTHTFHVSLCIVCGMCVSGGMCVCGVYVCVRICARVLVCIWRMGPCLVCAHACVVSVWCACAYVCVDAFRERQIPLSWSSWQL